MPSPAHGTTYEQVVRITHEYLGPAAERFISRQIRNHLHTEPRDMTKKDLSRLIEWIRLAMSLLTADSRIVEEYIGQLTQLTRTPRTRK
jgi:hypothetical protein